MVWGASVEVVNGKLDVTDAEGDTLGDIDDDEDPALDFVAGALELAAAELFTDDGKADEDKPGRMLELAIAELKAVADEALNVEFRPCVRKATTKSEEADEGLPN